MEPTPSQADQTKMLCDYAAELHRARKFETGAAVCRRVLAMDPNCAEAHNGLGAMLLNLGHPNEAIVHLDRATALAPKSAAAYGNMGLTYASMRLWDQSEKAFNAGLARAPGDVGLLWNRANMYLDRGDWETGLREYEVRIQHRGPPNFPKMPYPMWRGESLEGKTIFVQAEQGIGDRILTSRYLPWLKSLGARILYMSNANMHSLMWDFWDVVEFIPEGIPWPQADYGLFEMSLIGVHAQIGGYSGARQGFTPEQVLPDSGLIRSRAARDQASVNMPEPHHRSLKVGICWTGNPQMDRNWERSIPLEKLLPLAELPEVTLYSLQVGSNDILRLGANQVICDLSQDIGGQLSKTAAVMLNLDLVITVCTSMAHLAGALGVPTWVMLCHSPYWVWLTDRPGSVWYPNVRTFRQQAPGDWDPVVGDVRQELERLAEQKLHLDKVA